MKIEMLRGRLYRGEALDAGRVVEVDSATGDWFVGKGWAVKAAESPVLTTAEADALIPVQGKRRKSLR